MRRLSYKSHGMVGIGVREEESIGVVTTAESNTMETSVDFVDGMKFDKGFLSAYFCDDTDTGTTTLEDPAILLYDKKITNVQALLPALEMSKSPGKPMLIIAEDIVNIPVSDSTIDNFIGFILFCVINIEFGIS